MTTGKAPLDNRAETSDDGRAERYADIERRAGGKPGAKEMALTKNKRDEDGGKRAEKFVDIERRGDG